MSNVHGSKWCWPATRLAIYLRDGFFCTYCGRDLHDAPPRQVTLDHLVPRAKGGTNAPRNLVTACRTCNDAKNDTPWRTFVRGLFLNPETGYRRTLEIDRQRSRRMTQHMRLAKSIMGGTHPHPRVTRSARTNGAHASHGGSP